MEILIFTEGTILIHKSWAGLSREEVEERVKSNDSIVLRDFVGSVPIGDSVKKIRAWKAQGATISYLTSRTKPDEIKIIERVLRRYGFPKGKLHFRKTGEEYKNVAERVLPDIIIEDDCESIGGQKEMTYPRIRQALKARIKSIVVKEFGGIERLPDKISDLMNYG